MGSLYGDSAIANTGSAYVFTRSEDFWTEDHKLIASDGVAIDSFGVSVSIKGNIALVGSSNDDHPGAFTGGSTYVFVKSGNDWMQDLKIIASDSQENDYFGEAVSLSGGTALIGAFRDDANGNESGSAYFYELLSIAPGDLDDDGDADQSDLGILLSDFGCVSDCIGDADGDGDTDQSDLGVVLANFGSGG